MGIIFLLPLAIVVFVIAGVWKAFEKAGQPGWACLIPIYNYYIIGKIGGYKNWGLVFIPIAGIYFAIVMINRVSKSFGKDEGFTAGLVLLGFIFWPILGFGDAKYIGPNGVPDMHDDINNIGR